MNTEAAATIDYASVGRQKRSSLSPFAVAHVANLLLFATTAAVCYYYVTGEPFHTGPLRVKHALALWIAPAIVSLLTLAIVVRGIVHILRWPRSAGLRCAAVLSLAMPHVALQYLAAQYPLEYVIDIQIYQTFYTSPPAFVRDG